MTRTQLHNLGGPLLDYSAPRPDGRTYNHKRDGERLKGQHGRVWAAMRCGEWFTLAELSRVTCDPEASISARLRDLRKCKFGSHIIQREYVKRGLFRYRLLR